MRPESPSLTTDDAVMNARNAPTRWSADGDGSTVSAVNASHVPVVVTCRDRHGPLVELVSWLERAGHDEIVLLDNASTYPPLLAYLDATPHEVIRLGENAGPQAAWATGLVERRFPDRWYIVTDPDVVPAEECPLDVAAFMVDLLQRHRKVPKVGLGLKIDDLPTHYRFAHECRTLESEHRWPDKLVERHVYRASVDTTFALYRPGRPFQIHDAFRLGEPYVARHMPWYEDSSNPSEDERYYQDHAERWNNFKPDEFPDWMRPHVERVERGEAYVPPRPTAKERVKRLLNRR